MGLNRRDLLAECNMVGAPLDVFSAECCAFCINPECTRSGFGKSKFDVRVGTWAERLFTNVPRLDQRDPRYQSIHAQKFLTLDTSPAPSINSSWLDPRDLEKAPAAPVARAPEPLPAPAPAAPVAEAVPQPNIQEVAPAPAGPAPLIQGPIPRHMVMANTPVRAGKMLNDSTAQPKKDPWAAPLPPPPVESTLVQPGAKVKVGGSGV